MFAATTRLDVYTATAGTAARHHKHLAGRSEPEFRRLKGELRKKITRRSFADILLHYLPSGRTAFDAARGLTSLPDITLSVLLNRWARATLLQHRYRLAYVSQFYRT